MANVAFIRKEVSELLPIYYLIRDVLAGELTVKKAGTKYLPMPNAQDRSRENQVKYEAYKSRAVFYNVARRTLLGLIGQVFSKQSIIKMPTLLNPLVSNATGAGINLEQLSKKALQYTLAYSRCGIFVDYPATDETSGATVAELEAGKIRPTLYVYSPYEIINWRTVDRGAEEVISLVVIFESFIANDDGFEMKEGGQFRVLRLDENGEFVHEIWREPSPSNYNGTIPKSGNYVKHEIFRPKDANGLPLREIPFMFIGSDNNDPNPDNPNFYDLASLNIAHYRNSADYEQSCFTVGQATPVITGLTEDWLNTVLGGKVEFGSTGGIPLPEGANATLLQAKENGMLKEAMDAKERQMVAIGARLVEQKQVQRTATEASLESANETSTLAGAVANVNSAFLWALKWAARLLNLNENEIEFEINNDFDINRMSSAERLQIIKEWQSGAITFEEMRIGLRKAGIAVEEDQLAKDKIDIEISKNLEV